MASMSFDLLPPAVLRRRLARGGWVAAGVAGSAPAWGQSPGTTSAATATLVALLALLLALVLLAAGLRAQRRNRQQAVALRAARAEMQALNRLMDTWQWRTDAEHRLTAWRPPSVRSEPGFDPALATPLTDCFAADAAASQALQARLAQRAEIVDLRVQATGDGTPFVLRGQPLEDDDGRFAGYVGTARPVRERAAGLLTEVLAAMPTPAFRLAAPAGGEPARLVAHNDAGAAWLPEGVGPSPAWSTVAEGAPAPVRPLIERALAEPAPLATEGAHGWSLRTHRLPCVPAGSGEDELLVLLHRHAAADSPVTAASAAADDAESFSYTVSHDLRAPIRVVEGFTKIVKEDYGHVLDRVCNDHLDRVLAAAARMNSMIDSLLALSQLSSRPLSRQPVNLSLLAGYIIDDLRRQSPERQVELHIEPDLLVNGDPTLMRVVLENLLGNAWKYTGKNPAPRIWLERSEHEGRPAVTVRDNGAGFDMRFADRLFGVFQRLHSANDFQGTGIGLASVRRILRRHGGDIWAEAEVDRGARFQFWV